MERKIGCAGAAHRFYFRLLACHSERREERYSPLSGSPPNQSEHEGHEGN
jgi:hypothetical protein